MAVLPWVILAALGWAGFGVCVIMMRQRGTLKLVVGQEKLLAMPAIKETLESLTLPPQFNIPRDAEIFPQTQIEREIPEEMHELAALADPLIEGYETVKQDGEWKRHQVYAALLKKADLKGEKWKAAFAIELAIAQRRMGA